MSLLEGFQAVGDRADHAGIVRYVRDRYISLDPISAVVRRRQRMEQRLRLYEDDYEKDIEALIDLIFEDKRAQTQRKRLAALAKPHNVTRRIIDESAAVYDKPAKRTLASDTDQAVFDMVARTVELPEVQKHAHRLTNLCNEVLKWCEFSQATGRLALRIRTPDTFDVIPDPRDPLEVCGVLLDWAPSTLRANQDIEELAHYYLWDDTYYYRLSRDGKMLSVIEHNIGRIPGYLQHKAKPRVTLLDDHTGSDLCSAHLAVVFLNLLTIRLSKSQGENQPILRGNLARMAQKQSFDGETPLALPPDVTAEMMQSKTDPDHYLRTVRHFISGVAQTYGMSYEQFTFQESADTASGKAYQVRRERLSEMRDEQVMRSEKDEFAVAGLISDMLRVHGLPSFDAEAMHVQFADPRVPQDPGEELDLLERGIKLGVDNVLDYLMRDRSMTRDEAFEQLQENIALRAEVVRIMRALNMPAEPGEQPPQDVGTENRDAPEEEQTA